MPRLGEDGSRIEAYYTVAELNVIHIEFTRDGLLVRTDGYGQAFDFFIPRGKWPPDVIEAVKSSKAVLHKVKFERAEVEWVEWAGTQYSINIRQH